MAKDLYEHVDEYRRFGPVFFVVDSAPLTSADPSELALAPAPEPERKVVYHNDIDMEGWRLRIRNMDRRPAPTSKS